MTQMRILIVEDEAIIAHELAMTLEKNGYQVVQIASTADDAISGARDHSPHIILMDILLKGAKTGIEAAKQIHRDLHIPIIYHTGNTYLLHEDLLKATNSVVLTKPCPERMLIATIEQVVSNC